MQLLWFLVVLAFSIGEILYKGFFLIWFALGAFIAFILSIFIPDELLIQSIAFLSISIVLLTTQRKKFVHRFVSKNTIPTTIDELIGRKGLVIETIGKTDNKVGLVRLDGETWSAVSLDDSPIKKGATVVVDQIKGVRLIVSQVMH